MFCGFPAGFLRSRQPCRMVEPATVGDYSPPVGRREIGAELEPGFAHGGGSAARRSIGPRFARIPTPDPSALRQDSV